MQPLEGTLVATVSRSHVDGPQSLTHGAGTDTVTGTVTVMQDQLTRR